MKADWVVVGAGLTGATLAESIASKRKQTVLVVEQRDHIAGNAWEEYNEQGILEHKYGPHVFHTSIKEVWTYLSRFTRWTPYCHRVLGSVEGRLVPIPFNLNSIDELFSASLAARLSTRLVDTFGHGNRVPILKLRENCDADMQFLAEYIYEHVFKQYTRKQWGIGPEELLPEVTARVPVLVSRDNRYFQDIYQAMPSRGYGSMVRNMLSHSNICVLLNCRWQDVKDQVDCKGVVFTGSIDDYFGHMHGHLPYRSLNFDVQTLSTARYQPAPVVNYPNEHEYTRVTEFKLISGQKHPQTTIAFEYPLAYRAGENSPYYPIPTEQNRALYDRYATEANELKERVLFAGRLGDYTYYNMDQAVAAALRKFRLHLL